MVDTKDITLNYYNNKTDQFIERTRSSDFSALYSEFYSYLKPHGHILDLGCGCGRDSKIFLEAGYKVTAMDGSKKMCEAAEKLIGQNVIYSTFQDYESTEVFDGIWACASLLHLSYEDIVSVMKKLAKNLKIGGCFFASFRYGSFKGIRKERFFQDMTKKKLKTILKSIPEYNLISMEIGSDVRPNRKNEKWLYVFLKRE